MVRHIEKRSTTRRAHASLERVSEYFAPQKGDSVVRRFELLAILTQLEKGRRHNTILTRLWRWLRALIGVSDIDAVESSVREDATT